jgi:hypothetical protein
MSVDMGLSTSEGIEIISILDVLRIEVDALMCLANNLGDPKITMISWKGPASTELGPRLAALRTKLNTRTSHTDPQPASIQQQKEEKP